MYIKQGESIVLVRWAGVTDRLVGLDPADREALASMRPSLGRPFARSHLPEVLGWCELHGLALVVRTDVPPMPHP